VDEGGKIILPSSALDELSRKNISFPMLFKITNEKKKKHSHVGVLEFSGDEVNFKFKNN
jgi:ubiquitin fusion degradation protein 1